MNESLTIPKKKKGEADEFDFAGLRRKGLHYAQQLSGELWTDYNLHDPGVTILEQLCFALTDLRYRSEYSVPDLLTEPDGNLDYTALGLYAPEEIFPSRATTVHDYRRILFSEIEELDNIWLEPLSGSKSGLYHILVAPGPGVKGKEAGQGLQGKIAEVYARHRNLCEEINEIQILRPVPCRLEAVIRMDGKHNAEEMLATIYHCCAKEVAARLELTPYSLLAPDKAPEDLFNGPLTGGKISGLRRTARRPAPSQARFFSMLKKIAGVERVDHFHFSENQDILQKIIADGGLPCYQLALPENREQIRIRLTKNGLDTSFSYKRFHTRLKELEFKERLLRRQGSKREGLYPKPQGQYRNPGQYSSVQNLFPDIYGINAHGVPESYPAEEKAAATQLKAYLLPFEQLMADYLAQLEQLPRLFAVERDLRHSYFRQQLDSSTIPGMDKVLAPEAEKYFIDLHQRFDTYRERKNRVLDYLLALYGERVTGQSLRNFHLQQPEEFEDQLIALKANLLKHIVQVNRNRNAAVNYQEDIWGNPDNVSGLQRRVALLLGWGDGSHGSLTEVFRGEGLTVEDDCCGNRNADSDSDSGGVDGLEPVPLLESPPEETLADLREKAELLLSKGGRIPSTLLRDGVQLKAYWLSVRTSDEVIRVRFRPDGGRARWLPGLFVGREEVIEAVNALRRLLLRLNKGSQGMHIVEHILLRPAGQSEAERSSTDPDDFYAHRISVVLPSWTAHGGNRQFQLLVEETVRLNCPAHIMPTFYWLDAGRMMEFERLYRSSLAKQHCAGCDDHRRDQECGGLQNFLLRHAPPNHEE
jgi:hypothetical protein